MPYMSLLPDMHTQTLNHTAERKNEPAKHECQAAMAVQQAMGLPHPSGFTVGHIVVLPQHTEHALLPMPAAELVTNDRVPVEAGLDVSPLQALARRADNSHLVYNGRLAGLVLAGLAPCCNSKTPMGGNR